MRRICAILLLALTSLSHAATWRDDSYGCEANLPEGSDWQTIDAPSTADMKVLIAMQNQQRGSVLGINVLRDFPKNLADPTTQSVVESRLKTLGYTPVGKSSMIQIGGRDWFQVMVRSSQEGTTGIMRYAEANGQTYVVSLLRSGGQEPAKDPDLQATAASVRLNEISETPATPTPQTPAPTAPKATSPAVKKPAVREVIVEERVVLGPLTLTREQYRTMLYISGGVIVFLAIITFMGGGSKVNKPRRR